MCGRYGAKIAAELREARATIDRLREELAEEIKRGDRYEVKIDGLREELARNISEWESRKREIRRLNEKVLPKWRDRAERAEESLRAIATFDCSCAGVPTCESCLAHDALEVE